MPRGVGTVELRAVCPAHIPDRRGARVAPTSPGLPGIFALADADKLTQLVAKAGFHEVHTGTVTAFYETATPAQMTEWLRDVAPPIVNLLRRQLPEVRERVWHHVTEAWAPLTTTSGSVRTENQAIWLAATK